MPRKEKIYPLSREEREEVREFVKEQLKKEYIWPSKSLQTAPVFFVGKKNGKKRMVQDYRYLNEWTVKNNYPLPLISDVLENIGTKKVLQLKDLRVGQWEEPCIGLTQENSIESSVQDSLSYIPRTHGLC